MRREILWGEPIVPARIAAAVFSTVFLTLSGHISCAQELPSDLSLVIEQMAENGTSFEGMVDYYEGLASRRPDINGMSRAELERTHILSLFQIESLLEYRARCGNVLSEGELSLIDGFNDRLARICSVFFSFGKGAGRGGDGSSRHEITIKAVRPFGGDGVSLTGKYRFSTASRWRFALTADNDAGEGLVNGLPDFLSAFAAYEGGGAIRRAVVGDYTVRSGQGLVVWKSFALNSAVTPSSLMRVPSGVAPYTSTDEAAFFRGGALAVQAFGCDISVFASYNAVDARVVGDSLYTSISTGGYHRTASELANRRSMHEYVAGTTMTKETGRWRFGLSAICYSYDKRNGRSVKGYNRFQQYDGWWGNFGFDFFYHRGTVRLFGEAAVDAGGGFATVLGALWNPVYSLEASLLVRHYGKDYISTHSGAYSTLSSCSNQDGLAVSARWRISELWTMSANTDFSYYPWLRYGLDAPSSSFKSGVLIERRIGERSSVDFQARLSSTYTGTSFNLRADASLAVSPTVSFLCKLAANGGGFAGSVGFKALFFKRKLELSGRFTGYSTDGYSNRLYLYEGNVPQTYSVRALYGKGTGEYLMIKYSPVTWLSMWLKVSESGASYFMRIFIPG